MANTSEINPCTNWEARSSMAPISVKVSRGTNPNRTPESNDPTKRASKILKIMATAEMPREIKARQSPCLYPFKQKITPVTIPTIKKGT